MAAESYRYALLGVVGLVALVAVFTIIKTTGSSFTAPDDNVLGMGSENVIDAPAPTYQGSGASGGSGGGLTSSGSPSYACGSRASQPYFCNGDRACCGGSCVELPSCEGRQNGPVFTCGSRPMYCCHGRISLQSFCPSIADDSGMGPSVEGSQ